MPYKNWEDTQDIVERLRICRVKEIIDNLQDLRALIITRRIVKSSINLAQANMYAFEKNKRIFPNEQFVLDGTGDWSFYLDKLLISVRTIHFTAANSGNPEYIKELEDQSLEYINKILTLLHNLESVFTQSTLEKKYSLTWVDSNDEENTALPKETQKSSTRFRKCVKSFSTKEDMRKLIQQEIDECIHKEE